MLRIAKRFNWTEKHPLPFDSFKFMQKLEKANLSETQRLSLLSILQTALQQNLLDFQSQLVPVEEREKQKAIYKMDAGTLRSEIQFLERNEFTKLKQENERLNSELEKLKQRMREDLSKLQSSNRLELNLEKGKLFDDLTELQTKLKETEIKIEQEIGQAQSMLPHVKFDTLRTLLTTASTLGIVVLGYMRLFK